jgi:Putative lumazine-binding
MRFNRFLLLAATLTLATRPGAAPAQTSDREAVLTTVQRVFDAMRTRDTALLTQAFDTTARLIGVSTRGTAGVSLTAPSQFAAAIARAPAGDVWNERIYDPEIRIDGPVAQVWAYYTFHRNTTFSHCGVDAFMLLKVSGTWKITQLADSRRTEGCTHTEPGKNAGR